MLTFSFAHLTSKLLTKQKILKEKQKQQSQLERKQIKLGVAAILTAVQRKLGEYWSSLETRSTASGGIRL